LRFGDVADVELTIKKLGGKSIDFRYVVSSSGKRCAEGRVTCAVVDLAQFRAIVVPEHVRALLADLVEP